MLVYLEKGFNLLVLIFVFSALSTLQTYAETTSIAVDKVLTEDTIGSSEVSKKFVSLQKNNSEVQTLSTFLKKNGFQYSTLKERLNGLDREYIKGGEKESFKIYPQKYINKNTKKRAVLMHLEITGDSFQGGTYSFLIKEPNTVDDCGNVGTGLCCDYESETKLCTCFSCGGGGGGAIDDDAVCAWSCTACAVGAAAAGAAPPGAVSIGGVCAMCAKCAFDWISPW